MAGNAGITVADLINESLSILGVYSGEPLDAGDLQTAYFTLCAIVDGWGAEALTIFQKVSETFQTVAGQAAYTLGLAAADPDWVTSFLPTAFDAVTMSTGTGGAGSVELGLAINTELQWASIGIKTLQSNILSDMYPQLGTAVHTLNFYPVPNGIIPVNLYMPQQIPAFTATSNVLVLRPGYQEALTFEHAMKVSSKFGATIPEWLPEAWKESKANMKGTNFEPLDVRCDPALIKRSTSRSGGGSIRFYEGT